MNRADSTEIPGHNAVETKLFQAWRGQERAVLLVVAAENELRALGGDTSKNPWCAHPFSEGTEILLTGVGKVNAAGATAKAVDPARHSLVVSLGLGGALPGIARPMVSVGSIGVGTASLLADDGVQTPEGFLSITDLGFADATGSEILPDGDALAALRPFTDWAGPMATVSTGSGTDALAMEVASRTGAVVESMEGAAVGLAARRAGVGFLELRVVSNLTGDRDRQQWDFSGALSRLGALAARL